MLRVPDEAKGGDSGASRVVEVCGNGSRTEQGVKKQKKEILM